jgi:hypothetical protein
MHPLEWTERFSAYEAYDPACLGRALEAGGGGGEGVARQEPPRAAAKKENSSRLAANLANIWPDPARSFGMQGGGVDFA